MALSIARGGGPGVSSPWGPGRLMRRNRATRDPHTQLAHARAPALVVDVQTKRLALEQRRGALISRDVAITKAFSFARMLRDMCLAWPARIGPQLAAAFDVDATAVTVALEGHVREQLAVLARERPEF